MTVIQFDRRLRKLEASRKGGGVCFVAWGSSSSDVEDVVSAAAGRGLVMKGDIVVKAVWPFGEGMPESRWVQDGAFSFPHAEMGVLARYAEAVHDRVHDEMVAELAAEGLTPLEPDPAAPTWPSPAVRPAYLNGVSDERLIAIALGERHGAPSRPHEPSEQLVYSLLEIGSRACIRSCHEVVDRLREGARS